MGYETHKVRVTESGRMSIPADIRRAMGLEKGGIVQLKLDEDGLHLETPHLFIKRIQKMAKADGWHDKVSVDDFLAWRREEFQREQEELDRK
jgi:AbrB family looped-hinge helix DNA binding protein